MEVFLQLHQEMIEERQNAMLEIERAIFGNRSNLTCVQYNILSYQSIPMIYSIWEGFIKATFLAYSEYLNAQELVFDQLTPEMRVFQMEIRFQQLKEYPTTLKKKIAFYDRLSSFFKEPQIEIRPIIDTESNIDFKVLNKILLQFGLEPFPEKWGADYNYPNPDLALSMATFLKYRNNIVHGSDISSEVIIDREIYERFKKLVTDLMYGIHDKLFSRLSVEA